MVKRTRQNGHSGGREPARGRGGRRPVGEWLGALIELPRAADEVERTPLAPWAFVVVDAATQEAISFGVGADRDGAVGMAVGRALSGTAPPRTMVVDGDAEATLVARHLPAGTVCTVASAGRQRALLRAIAAELAVQIQEAMESGGEEEEEEEGGLAAIELLLESTVEPDVVRKLCAAAMAARDAVDGGTIDAPMRLDCDALDLEGGCVVVHPHDPEVIGLLPSVDDLDRGSSGETDGDDDGEGPVLGAAGAMTALVYVDRSALPEEVAAELAERGWGLDDETVAHLMCVDEDGEARPPERADVEKLTACALAVVAAAGAASDGEPGPHVLDVVVPLAGRTVAGRVTLPHPDLEVQAAGADGAERNGDPFSGDLYQIEISLDDVEPRVWRRIEVRGGMTLGHLHDVLQIAMGWEMCHLFEFQVGDIRYADAEEPDDEAESVDAIRLEELLRPKMELGYLYDFGDSWQHTLRVVKVGPAVDGAPPARILDGAAACPPEDAGGPPGYERLLAARADKGDERHADAAEWLGDHDPLEFDLAAVNARLAELWDTTGAK